jgi:hypothetical protein
MKAIVGRVSAVDASTRSFTVSAVVRGPSGRDRTRQFEVPWSRNTECISKGKRKVRSLPKKIKRGMNVIVQLKGPRLPADVVWHEPTRGTIALTVRECRDLGGEIQQDGSCPNISSVEGQRLTYRCKTAGGSSCIIVAKN